jgi:hypothetical protein
MLISKLRKIRIKIRMQFLFNFAKNEQTNLALIATASFFIFHKKDTVKSRK